MSDEQDHHDDLCEADFQAPPYGYTACACAHRHEGKMEGMAMTNFSVIERPFSDADSATRCRACQTDLSGRQVVRVPVEYPDDVFCDLACARVWDDQQPA